MQLIVLVNVALYYQTAILLRFSMSQSVVTEQFLSTMTQQSNKWVHWQLTSVHGAVTATTTRLQVTLPGCLPRAVCPSSEVLWQKLVMES